MDVGWEPIRSQKPAKYGVTYYSGSTGVRVGSFVYLMYGTISYLPDRPWGHVLDYANNTWKALYNKPSSEKAPTLREMSSLTLAETHIYSFGGKLKNQDRRHDDTISAFDDVLEEWRTLTTTGDSPSLEKDSYYPFGHYMETSSSILYLVGRFAQSRLSKDTVKLFLLSLDSSRWSKVEAKGRPPHIIRGQTCASERNLFVLPPADRSPLFILSLSEPFTWTDVDTDSYLLNIPRASGHLVYLPKWGRLLVLGGRAEVEMSAREFFFDPKDKEWTEPEKSQGVLQRIQKATWSSRPGIWNGACISTTDFVLLIDYTMVEKDGSSYYKVHISKTNQG